MLFMLHLYYNFVTVSKLFFTLIFLWKTRINTSEIIKSVVITARPTHFCSRHERTFEKDDGTTIKTTIIAILLDCCCLPRELSKYLFADQEEKEKPILILKDGKIRLFGSK